MKVTHVKPENWIDTSETGVIQPSGVAGLVHEIVLEEGDLMQGPPGAKGEPGATGPQGVPGVKGDAGAAGPQGVPGVKGDTGEAGLQGVQGVKGDTGEAGPQGVPGVKGDTGEAGPQGVPGEKGDTGAAGPQGVPGSAGVACFGVGAYAMVKSSAIIGVGDNVTSEGQYGTIQNTAAGRVMVTGVSLPAGQTWRNMTGAAVSIGYAALMLRVS